MRTIATPLAILGPIVVAAASTLLAGCQAPDRANPTVIDATLPTQPLLELRVGQPASLTLQSSAGTGYEWVYVRDMSAGELPVTVNPKRTRAVSPGVAGGPTLWDFQVWPERAGRAALTFELRRPWEKDAPAAERAVIPVLVTVH
ncbi:MAG: protease inhibitor I42 family protein [Planctomycetota bacterium]|nr:protease inhibitor I42 family protein [Planctomycetota bacterium]MDA1106571.1 protease inhibitor I42 family protein [Planctomycetota bacterium]